MAKDASHYCSQCVSCQKAKAPLLKSAPLPKSAPLRPIIAIRPREMAAVDILKVPASLYGNQYILAAQDYFSKWPFAYAMPDQKADQIVRALKDNVFALVGPPPP